MRGAVRVVLVLAVLGAGIVLPGTAAQACSCVAAGEARRLQWADAVFYGEVIDREVQRESSGTVPPFGARVTYTLDVVGTYSGEVPGRVKLLTITHGAACGDSLDETPRILVFGTEVKGNEHRAVPWYTTNLCSGSSNVWGDPPETLGDRPFVERPAAFDAEPQPTDQLTDESVDESSTETVVSLGVGVVVLALLTAAGLLWWRRRPT